MRSVSVLIAATALLGACAPPPFGPGGSPVTGSGDDCEVIAAVLTEHYEFGPANPPPPVRFFPGYEPRCDWARLGVTLAEADAQRGLAFGRPKYSSQGAVVETSLIHGPLAGAGYVCRLRSGFAGWTVAGECEMAWIS